MPVTHLRRKADSRRDHPLIPLMGTPNPRHAIARLGHRQSRHSALGWAVSKVPGRWSHAVWCAVQHLRLPVMK